MNSYIEIKELSFQYSETEPSIVADLNLSITHPENILVLGDNGSGKSTLGKLLCGLLVPSKGHVLINQMEISKIKSKNRIHQAYYINQMNQLQFVSNSMVKEIRFVERISAKKADLKKLNDFYLPIDTSTNPFELLVNEAWRFSLYLATIIEPAILFIDELPSAVNKRNNHCMNLLLNERKQKGLTTFIAYQRPLVGISIDKTIKV